MSVQHGVLVNEIRINAVGRAAHWWCSFLARSGDRVEELQATLGGAVCWVRCDDREHAQWLAAHMIGQGIHASAVRATTRQEQP